MGWYYFYFYSYSCSYNNWSVLKRQYITIYNLCIQHHQWRILHLLYSIQIHWSEFVSSTIYNNSISLLLLLQLDLLPIKKMIDTCNQFIWTCSSSIRSIVLLWCLWCRYEQNNSDNWWQWIWWWYGWWWIVNQVWKM